MHSNAHAANCDGDIFLNLMNIKGYFFLYLSMLADCNSNRENLSVKNENNFPLFKK